VGEYRELSVRMEIDEAWGDRPSFEAKHPTGGGRAQGTDLNDPASMNSDVSAPRR
jgi:hypothetical protein